MLLVQQGLEVLFVQGSVDLSSRTLNGGPSGHVQHLSMENTEVNIDRNDRHLLPQKRPFQTHSLGAKETHENVKSVWRLPKKSK